MERNSQTTLRVTDLENNLLLTLLCARSPEKTSFAKAQSETTEFRGILTSKAAFTNCLHSPEGREQLALADQRQLPAHRLSTRADV
jgi:hypothetical protein